MSGKIRYDNAIGKSFERRGAGRSALLQYKFIMMKNATIMLQVQPGL